MNLTASVMLIDKTVRPVRVEYDPDNKLNNNPCKLFKTIDPDIKVDDLVVCQTNTRHGFTICKVVEIDFPVDFNSPEPWGWIAQKFDKTSFDKVIVVEAGVKQRVAKAEENQMREQLKSAMGLGNVDFSDLDLRKLGAPSTPTPQDPASSTPA